MSRGFTLMFAVLLLLILSTFSMSVLLLAGSYFRSTGSFVHAENIKTLSESKLLELVGRHNNEDVLDADRFFFAPSNWDGLALKPFEENGTAFHGKLLRPWNSSEPNTFQLNAGSHRYQARQQMSLTQQSFESFALYSDAPITIPTASLIDGPVFARGGITLGSAGSHFLDFVQGAVAPRGGAVFATHREQQLRYPRVNSAIIPAELRDAAQASGAVIPDRAPDFWRSDHYELDLSHLHITSSGSGWRIRYGAYERTVTVPVLHFPGDLHITQDFRLSQPADSLVPRKAVYINAEGDVSIGSSIQPLIQDGTMFGIAIIACDAMYLTDRLPAFASIEALLVAAGSDELSPGGPQFAVSVNPGMAPLTSDQKAQALLDVSESSFLFESALRNEIEESIRDGTPVVWFRGGVAAAGEILFATSLRAVHFQQSRFSFPAVKRFPFLTIHRGSMKWL